MTFFFFIKNVFFYLFDFELIYTENCITQCDKKLIIFLCYNNNNNCRVTNCSPNPKEMNYKPNKLNTINL